MIVSRPSWTQSENRRKRDKTKILREKKRINYATKQNAETKAKKKRTGHSEAKKHSFFFDLNFWRAQEKITEYEVSEGARR